jgi:hypothetical protein
MAMARIDWVKQRLENWARWCQQSESGALGYPKQSAFVRMGVPSRPSTDSIVPVQSIEASETDDAVKSLQLTQSHLYQAVTLTYAKGLPRHKVARMMCRAESTVSQNLCDADVVIKRWFDDKAVIRAERKLENTVSTHRNI